MGKYSSLCLLSGEITLQQIPAAPVGLPCFSTDLEGASTPKTQSKRVNKVESTQSPWGLLADCRFCNVDCCLRAPKLFLWNKCCFVELPFHPHPFPLCPSFKYLHPTLCCAHCCSPGLLLLPQTDLIFQYSQIIYNPGSDS